MHCIQCEYCGKPHSSSKKGLRFCSKLCAARWRHNIPLDPDAKPIAEKICVRCGKVKPLADFVRRSRTWHGRASDCRECRSASAREWHARKPKTTFSRLRMRYRAFDKARLLFKTCNYCKLMKPVDEFYEQKPGRPPNNTCRPCHKVRLKLWIADNPGKYQAGLRRRHLANQYGITPEDFDALVRQQQGRCAICRTPLDLSNMRKLALDHSHKTGLVRGILCNGCNTGIGVLKDDPLVIRRAARYVERHEAEHLTKRPTVIQVSLWPV